MVLNTPATAVLGSNVRIAEALEQITPINGTVPTTHFDGHNYDKYTYFVYNNSNVSVTIQLQVAPTDAADNSSLWQNKGSAYVLTAGSAAFDETQMYYPFMRYTVVASGAGTGTVDIYARALKG